MKVPILLPAVVVSDDAGLAAQMSCILAKPRSYVPVIDGPRMGRPDHAAETIRRNNGIARAKARHVFQAGLSSEAEEALKPYLSEVQVRRVSDSDDIAAIQREHNLTPPPLTWGHDYIGLGLLTALNSGAMIHFTEHASSSLPVPSRSGHLVVCESGENLSEVIAANYAFSLSAGMHVIPKQPGQVTKAILEAFYSLNDPNEVSPTQQLRDLASKLRDLCVGVDLPIGGSLTFVTDGIPYGFAFPEAPSTHLFKYPDLGIAVINGFSREQPKTRGTNVAVLIDPLQTDAPEIDAASELLADRRMFVRGHRGAGATVHAVSQTIELFPYDVLILATHCGDAGGWRSTYEFTDSSGRARVLVVDVAIGVGDPKGPDDKLEVMEFTRFHELDGVLWDDPDRDAKLEVGSAIKDYTERRREADFKPVRTEHIPRVMDSVALKMFDNNYLALPRSLAGKELPIIINNACASWRELADRFTFASARAYIGTLFPIATTEAHDVVMGALGKFFEKELPHAFWSAQNRVYGDGVRRPYVITGVYTQRLRVTHEDVPLRLYNSMKTELRHWQKRMAQPKAPGVSERGIKDIMAFYEREVEEFGTRWLGLPPKSA